MATVTVPPDVSPWDAPLTPSYPPALSPGTKRARPAARRRAVTPTRGCALPYNRWDVDVEAVGALEAVEQALGVSGRGGRAFDVPRVPGVAKALSHVAVEHIRGAFVSSVNFHGNKSYAGRCVCLERKHADPESDASREVFLVAATRADANEWVAKVRALVAERNPIDTDDAIRLSPVAAPPTPALGEREGPETRPRERVVVGVGGVGERGVVVVFVGRGAPPF